LDLKKSLEEVSIEIEQNEKLIEQLSVEFQKRDREILGLSAAESSSSKYGLAR